jgi:hypothetical protein
MRTCSGENRRISEPEKHEIAMTDESGRGRGRFFVISKVVESPETLQGWVEWFRNRNIPCAIEKRRGGGFILWREGEEIGGKSPIPLAELKKKRIVGSFGL